MKYINGIVIGMPIWFVLGILITFSPEFGQALGLVQPVDAGKAVMFAFAGQVAGNFVSGFISQRLQSRKKAILLFILSSASFVSCLFAGATSYFNNVLCHLCLSWILQWLLDAFYSSGRRTLWF